MCSADGPLCAICGESNDEGVWHTDSDCIGNLVAEVSRLKARLAEAKPMKLFVWVDPYETEGLAAALFVVAENESQAREIAFDRQRAKSYWDCFLYVRNNWLPPKCVKLGPPTRVIDLPCAEWHEVDE